METLLAIIFIVFGILQIMLFFKLWVMTSNVKRILRKIGTKDLLAEASVLYLKGDIEKTKEAVKEAFVQEIAISFNCKDYGDWYIESNEIINKYKTIYQKLGMDSSDLDKYGNPDLYLQNN